MRFCQCLTTREEFRRKTPLRRWGWWVALGRGGCKTIPSPARFLRTIAHQPRSLARPFEPQPRWMRDALARHSKSCSGPAAPRARSWNKPMATSVHGIAHHSALGKTEPANRSRKLTPKKPGSYTIIASPLALLAGVGSNRSGRRTTPPWQGGTSAQGSCGERRSGTNCGGFRTLGAPCPTLYLHTHLATPVATIRVCKRMRRDPNRNRQRRCIRCARNCAAIIYMDVHVHILSVSK